MLSLVLPAYNEEKNIVYAYEKISNILTPNKINFELIFVNDGSKDNTWEKIKHIAASHSNVRGICFSRNFGKEAAIMAGLSMASGECCVVMDCDLQHPPEAIITMYQYWKEGFDIVEGVKSDRGKENFLHTLSANVFYKLIGCITSVEMQNSSDFKLMDKKVVDCICQFPEKDIFFRAISSWVGYKTTQVKFVVQEREFGISKWSIKSLIKYAITNITSFSTAPMQFATILGVGYIGVSFVLIIWLFWTCFVKHELEILSIILILILFTGGSILCCLGIIGYYISKIFNQVKNRPRYIISEKV